MSYHSKTIKQAVRDIEFEKTFLPAIQRKFVWPRRQIEVLFDSLMRNFPIGSFLFWELKSTKAYEYVFYSFLKNYDERTPNNVRKTSSFLHPEIIGVLDGQQRLSSLYLGLQGSHRQRLKYHKSKEDYAYPETFLYLNLLSLPYTVNTSGRIEIDRDRDFEFRFLKRDQAEQITSKNNSSNLVFNFWYRVGDVLRWDEDPEIDEIYEDIIDKCEDPDQRQEFINQKRFIKKGLRDLHKRICDDQLINYFKVTKDDLDDILKIFIRVNSGGTILSKTDLLFSTIVATWEDGRAQIESFLKDLNTKGDGFSFNNDFLMRCCLVLSDLQVLFKVNSFKSGNVQLIKNNWEAIKKALNRTVDLLVSFGFNSSLLTSQNAAIVIAYHFMKGGDESPESKEGIRKYILHSLLKNVYGGQGDQVITSFRNALREEVKDEELSKKFKLRSTKFPINEFLDLRLPANKSLKISNDDIEEFMTYKKGANSFFILSLLYPNIKFTQVHFHQDHIHPNSKFKDINSKPDKVSLEAWDSWKEIKDTVPNLQLLEGSENKSKNATHFKDWFYGANSRGELNVVDKKKYIADNFIPDTGYEFDNFQTFYKLRRDLMVNKLKVILGLNDN